MAKDQDKYFICYHRDQADPDSVCKRRFSSLARAIDFRSKNNLEQYAIQKIPNASTFIHVEEEDEKRLKVLGIPFIKPPYDAPPMPLNLRCGRCKSITVAFDSESSVVKELPECPVWSRHFEPKFESIKSKFASSKDIQISRSIDGAFQRECCQIVKEVDFEEEVVPALLEESLSTISVFDFEEESESEYACEEFGISILVKDFESMLRLRSALPKGYSAFEYGLQFPKHAEDLDKLPPGSLILYKIVILKATPDDRYLKLMGTDAVNYNISNKDIRAKVKSWRSKYGAVLIGAASYNALTLKFPQIVDSGERTKLVKEVIQFCPEILAVSAEGAQDLEAHLSSDGLVNLWWD